MKSLKERVLCAICIMPGSFITGIDNTVSLSSDQKRRMSHPVIFYKDKDRDRDRDRANSVKLPEKHD
eukprot:Awhi_evm1s8686